MLSRLFVVVCSVLMISVLLNVLLVLVACVLVSVPLGKCIGCLRSSLYLLQW